MKIIHIEDALDLAEKSGQESKVAASHPNQSDQYLRREWLIGRWPRFEKSVVCTIITNAEQPDNAIRTHPGLSSEVSPSRVVIDARLRVNFLPVQIPNFLDDIGSRLAPAFGPRD